MPLDAGRTTVEFFTPTPPILETVGSGGRQLAFALYNPHLTVAEP
jgi:hypothetical protein